VAEHQGRHLICNGVQLLQDGQNKYSCFTHTRLGLTKNISSEYGLWKAFVLHF
jgi:hypothetical protein